MIKAEVIKIEPDENNNIKVTTRYTDENGAVIQDGVTRYSLGVLPTLDEIEALLDIDIDQHCQNLIAREFSKKLKIDAEQRNVDNIDALKMKVLGKKKEVETSDLRIGKRVITVNKDMIISSKTLSF